MGNDLISRKALLEEINSYHYNTVNPEIRRAEHFVKAHICELIDKQPTAYGLDKVVERLEERVKSFKSLNSDDEIVDVAIKETQRNIEIVKFGGIE